MIRGTFLIYINKNSPITFANLMEQTKLNWLVTVNHSVSYQAIVLQDSLLFYRQYNEACLSTIKTLIFQQFVDYFCFSTSFNKTHLLSTVFQHADKFFSRRRQSKVSRAVLGEARPRCSPYKFRLGFFFVLNGARHRRARPRTVRDIITALSLGCLFVEVVRRMIIAVAQDRSPP